MKMFLRICEPRWIKPDLSNLPSSNQPRSSAVLINVALVGKRTLRLLGLIESTAPPVRECCTVPHRGSLLQETQR